MTNPRKRGAIKILAILMAVSLSQIYVQMGMAQQLLSGRLTTTGGRSITVNGTSAASGASILTGATIETGDGVGATIDLGALGVVEVDPNSKIELTFADDGSVRVKMLQGCAKVKKSGAGVGEVYTAEGASEKNNGKNAAGFCYLNGGLNSIGQTVSTAATGGGAGGGLSTEALVAILAGGGALAGGLIWALSGGGGNSSPH